MNQNYDAVCVDHGYQVTTENAAVLLEVLPHLFLSNLSPPTTETAQFTHFCM